MKYWSNNEKTDIIMFLDPENMVIDTRSKSLCVSEPEIWAKVIKMAAILNLCKLGIKWSSDKNTDTGMFLDPGNMGIDTRSKSLWCHRTRDMGKSS